MPEAPAPGEASIDPRADGPSLSRRERERRRRRQAMLRAAQQVFAAKGYAQATLDEIAERAEFGKGTLYNYFEGGKEDILFAVFDTIYGDLRALVRDTFSAEQVRRQPPREAFRALVRSAFDFLLEREELFLILMKEECQFMFGDDPEKVAYFREQGHRLVEAMTPALEAAMEDGAMRPLPPQAVAHMLEGNINGILMHLTMARHDENCPDSPIDAPDKAVDFLTTMLFDGLAAGGSTEADEAEGVS
ncbi:MAG: TetR/AcrR family transcriptional regulator [Bacteroidetes bacterium QH_8_67_23]|nr:MAG: TetR/AcrR family transcriptional regulator [Bacteroidetes bacterium QH_8_67_23]